MTYRGISAAWGHGATIAGESCWDLESRREPGQRRGTLFRDDTDRRRFLGLVSELPERFSLEVHAFVLMRTTTTCCSGAGVRT